MDMCTITQATFTSTPPRALRQGLSIDKQNCLHNSALICGTEAFNVKSNSFRVNWSLTACLDVLFNASGGPGSRRTDAGLQTGRLYVLKNNNNPSACPSKMQRAEVHRRKQQLCFFSPPVSVVAHYATDWNLESVHREEQSRAEPSQAEPSRVEPRLQTPAAKKKKEKEKSKMVSDPWRVTLKFCSTDPVTAHAEGPNILFLLLSCSISSLENWVTPPSSPPSPSPSFTRSLHLFLPPRHKEVLPET